MNRDKIPRNEAETLANLLHSLIRRLTSGDHDDPVTDLPLAQLRLCNALCGKPRSMSAISRELGTSLSAVTQIADRLERAGLIKRVPRGDDRRVRCLRLTDRGEKMMRLHEENRIQRMSEVLTRLAPDERQAATAALESLVKAAGEVAGRDGNPKERKVHSDTSKVLI
ncbi:MAG: MarR family transcriptional regulator [Planctomycetes bacterium]|nr:MarR family transcriptional regulator [Planctomycetota bacterium]MCG2684517.1 MarR family transcriptional regulator [Planctomycetales bacterium]